MEIRSLVYRLGLLTAFGLALALAQSPRDLTPDHAARLKITVQRSDSGEVVPARVYLFKGEQPFRLSPVEAQLPLRPDLFYRERIWRRATEPTTLEVTARDASHFILLDGEAEFDLPAAANYRIEAYRGIFFEPARAEFELVADQRHELVLEVRPIASEEQGQWLSGDDHIHLMRDRQDDEIFLQWMQAEDLAVGNFLELQRQQHAAVQYAFGAAGEARRSGVSIRSGHESRSRFYGHVLLLGGERMIRPLSIGLEYANSPAAYPFPGALFSQGRELGALTGFAHFYGSQPNSSMLMNLAHGELDFIELFQFGQLQTEPWYELLNAGFRIAGLAGSDFPANVGRYPEWPRGIPLLGPERALVKAAPGESAFRAWADGVWRGAAMLSNGPLLSFEVEGGGAGDVVEWSGPSREVQVRAKAVSYRPLERLEIVINGRVAESAAGDGKRRRLELDAGVQLDSSAWIAVRARAKSQEGEPPIVAHSNPAYFLRQGKPVYVESARRAVAERWRAEAAYYRNGEFEFSRGADRERLLQRVAETERILASIP